MISCLLDFFFIWLSFHHFLKCLQYSSHFIYSKTCCFFGDDSPFYLLSISPSTVLYCLETSCALLRSFIFLAFNVSTVADTALVSSACERELQKVQKTYNWLFFFQSFHFYPPLECIDFTFIFLLTRKECLQDYKR